MIVSLSGAKRSGKSTIATMLVSKFNFTEIALADPLREICSRVFDIPLTTFLDDNLKETPFERPIFLNEDMLGHMMAIIENEWGFEITRDASNAMSEFLGHGFAHPRQILQFVGTEIIRGSIDNNIFLALADKRIDRIVGNVVVSDVRFKVERDWARSKGAKMVLIKRPSKVAADTHISENDLGEDSEYTVTMDNSNGITSFLYDTHLYFSTILQRRN